MQLYIILYYRCNTYNTYRLCMLQVRVYTVKWVAPVTHHTVMTVSRCRSGVEGVEGAE